MTLPACTREKKIICHKHLSSSQFSKDYYTCSTSTSTLCKQTLNSESVSHHVDFIVIRPLSISHIHKHANRRCVADVSSQRRWGTPPLPPKKPVKQYLTSLNKGVVGGSRYWARGRYRHDAVSTSLQLSLNGFNFSLVWQAPGEHTEIHDLNSHAELGGYLFVCVVVCCSGDNLRTRWKSYCCYVHCVCLLHTDAFRTMPVIQFL